MGSPYGDLILIIIDQHFGSTAKLVAGKLLYGPKPLKLILHNVDLKTAQVKEALHILIRHSLITFKSSKTGMTAEYKLNYENILKLLRFSKYLELTEKKFGHIGKELIETLMVQGYSDLSHLILRVAKSSMAGEKINLTPILDKLKALVECAYVIRYCDINSLGEDQQNVPKIVPDPDIESLVSDLDVKRLYECLEMEDSALITDHVYFSLNLKRFDLDYRNEIILECAERRFGSDVRIVTEELLDLGIHSDDWTYNSHVIPASSVKPNVVRKHKRDHNTEHIIKLLEDPTCGWIKYSTDVSNSLVIRYGHVIHVLANTLIENVVQAKFGPKAARIFRIIKCKKFIEQNQIQRLAMIPDKEAKTLTYNLLHENFVMIQELRKPGAAQGPNKSFILFHIDLKLVIEVVLKNCYKSLCNANIRIAHETDENQSLLDKYLHIESLKKSVHEQQDGNEEILEALNQLMCPKEKEQLAMINKTMNLLESSLLQVTDTIFILEMFKHYMSVAAQ